MDHQDSVENVRSEAKDPTSGKTLERADLLGNLSQELRSPLNSILGFASLLKEPELSESDRKQFLDCVIANGDHLLQILDDALNFSKIEKGEIFVKKVSFNISDMVYDVAKALKSAALKKNLDLHITFKTKIPQSVTSDPLKTRQVLTNLIGNAIRYAEEDGFILISLSCDDLAERPYLVVEIDDSGAIGAKDETGSSTQKLVELKSTFNQNYTIVRPGFALSQKFAEVIGGHLNVRPSHLGKGRSFCFEIPVGDITNVTFLNKKKLPSFIEKISSSFQKINRLENVRILLAEDSSDNETLIRLYLSKEGSVLTFVQNGLEAVDAVKSGEFDLILMDIQMPLLDGLEATRQIRQLGFVKPIIALTGYALRDDAEKSLKAGCDTHMAKPVRKETLIAEIQKRVFH